MKKILTVLLLLCMLAVLLTPTVSAATPNITQVGLLDDLGLGDLGNLGGSGDLGGLIDAIGDLVTRSVTIRTTVNGAPAPGATVSLSSTVQTKTVVTGSDGRATVSGLISDSYTITASYTDADGNIYSQLPGAFVLVSTFTNFDVPLTATGQTVPQTSSQQPTSSTPSSQPPVSSSTPSSQTTTSVAPHSSAEFPSISPYKPQTPSYSVSSFPELETESEVESESETDRFEDWFKKSESESQSKAVSSKPVPSQTEVDDEPDMSYSEPTKQGLFQTRGGQIALLAFVLALCAVIFAVIMLLQKRRKKG